MLTWKLMNPKKMSLRAKIGQLLWACNQTRPDLSNEVCSPASEQKGGTVKNLISENKQYGN